MNWIQNFEMCIRDSIIDGANDLFGGSMPLEFMNMARFDW